MIAELSGDDFVLGRFAGDLPIEPRGFERRFVGFGTPRGKEEVPDRTVRQLRQPGRQGNGRAIRAAGIGAWRRPIVASARRLPAPALPGRGPRSRSTSRPGRRDIRGHRRRPAPTRGLESRHVPDPARWHCGANGSRMCDRGRQARAGQTCGRRRRESEAEDFGPDHSTSTAAGSTAADRESPAAGQIARAALTEGVLSRRDDVGMPSVCRAFRPAFASRASAAV